MNERKDLFSEDTRFMRLAITEAKKGDLPFGTVIVRDGRVLAAGQNLTKTRNDPTAHGEIVAIRRFVATRPAGELKKVTLYTSAEPCSMCMSAIIWCGISRIVFGMSMEEKAQRLEQIMLPCRVVAKAASFGDITITGGILSAEATALFHNP